MKHLQKFNENTSEEKIEVRVKDLIEYLQQFDGEMELSLDKDGWMAQDGDSGVEIISKRGLFSKPFEYKGKKYLILNN
jgi:hypothetical protein